MKKICLSLMVFLFFTLVFAQNLKSDLVKENIKGKAVSMTETIYSITEIYGE